MAQSFYERVNGVWKRVFAIVSSAGAADAGKIIGADANGLLDPSFLPPGIGANQAVAPAFEALSAGEYINLFNDAGTLKARKADNSNGRPAHGYVGAAVAVAATATVKRLNTVNSHQSGLSAGDAYWLGTAGGVISAPLDATDLANSGKVCQYLGIAKSATELVTVEEAPVYL